MEQRLLLGSGFNVPAISFGTATFGGKTEFFSAWGNTQVEEATRLVDICLEAGINLFDTANNYSLGLSEEILGKALKGKRGQALLSTKATFRVGDGANQVGSSRHFLTRALEDSLRRLNTDYVDLYTIHGFDALTPIEETLRTLDDMVQSGKVRYIGCSNFSGWHLMKSLAISEKYGWSRYVAHQAFYSLTAREFEWELMPLAIDQKVGTMVWSPLSGGLLSGKYHRNHPVPTDTRVAQIGQHAPDTPPERLYAIVDALEAIAAEVDKTIPQVALNWVLQRPTVASIVIGARNEEQLRQNLGAIGWNLSAEQVARLDQASAVAPVYPYWHQSGFQERNPSPV